MREYERERGGQPEALQAPVGGTATLVVLRAEAVSAASPRTGVWLSRKKK